MAITNLPTFEADEILPASKLNTLRDAIENKFAGGVSGADLGWPLTADGNLDMAGYSILGVKRFWNIYNAAEYSTLQAAIDAAEATSGGCVLVPPNTNLSADGLTVTSGDIAIIGCGSTSVISHSSGASAGYLLRTAAGLSNFTIANIYLDGSTNAAAGQAGLYFQQATNVHIDNVVFNDFTGDHLVLRNDGTAGNNCEDVFVSNCRFLNGDTGHIFMDDIDGLYVSNCRFKNPTTDAIEGVPSGSSAKMRSIMVSDSCRFTDGARAVYIVGGSGTASPLWRLVQVQGAECYSQSGNVITVGASSAIITAGRVNGNTIISAGADAIVALMSTGQIIGNYAPSATGDGLDMTSCDDVVARANDFPDAGARGIDATSTTNCRVLNNDVHNASTEGVTKDSATGLYCHNNVGEQNTLGWSTVCRRPGETDSSNNTGTFSESFTIPANTLKVGDVIRVFVKMDGSAAGVKVIMSMDGGSLDLDVATTTAGGRAAGMVEVRVAALSGSNSAQAYAFGGDDNGQASCDEQNWTVDFTSDVTIVWQWDKSGTGSNTVGLEQVSYEIIGGSS